MTTLPCLAVFGFLLAPQQGPERFARALEALPVVEEIDTAEEAPVHEFPAKASRVESILDRRARVLPPGDEARAMAWVIGKGKELKAGAAYVLTVEFPDDVPRAIFIANRGGDLVRGFATGTATGDARRQFVQPSLESLAYPQSGKWTAVRTLFFLNHRFQGLFAVRDPRPGHRPYTPEDGFHVLIFQGKRLDDPRSRGAAVGKIRLHAVPDLGALDLKPELPPAELPRRRIFFREEMADQVISAPDAEDRCISDPVEWYVQKARIARVLGINTFAKDLLEFGYNQGWDSGDEAWAMNARPPLKDLWSRLVPRIAAEGLGLLPYYEFKGTLGYPQANPKSLGWQRRAEKLYHGRPNPDYTPVAWTKDHNADLTDPDTLADARKVLDRTVMAFKDKASFAGVWFRTRGNHLPVSFSEAAVARFLKAYPGEKASRDLLIASYEGDRKLYDRYLAWWFGRRRAFFDAIRDHVADGLGKPGLKLIFTPWIEEQVPMLRDPASGEQGHPVQIVTDDPKWWDAYAKKIPSSSWYRWALVPTPFEKVLAGNYYGRSLEYREPVTAAPRRWENFHAAPGADPETWRDGAKVMVTFPIGRMFTVGRADLMDRYRSRAGLTVIRHYTLNEDNHDRKKGPSNLPFDGQAGYVSVDVDRAGPFVRIQEARAIARSDPTNLGYLAGSSFSVGNPEYVRRFNAAFLSVPALPSAVVPGAADSAEVVVRRIRTEGHGTYFFVINPSMRPQQGVTVTLPAEGPIRDLVDRRTLEAGPVRLDLHPGELRSYRIQ